MEIPRLLDLFRRNGHPDRLPAKTDRVDGRARLDRLGGLRHDDSRSCAQRQMEQNDIREEKIVHGVDPLISLPLIINNIMNYHQKLRSREFRAAILLSLYVWILQ